MDQNMKRIRQIKLALSDDEEKTIRKKMASVGTTNMNAYLRKMAIDGLIVKLDEPEIKELVSLLSHLRDRVDQMADRAEENVLDDIRQNQKRLIELANSILLRLAAIK